MDIRTKIANWIKPAVKSLNESFPNIGSGLAMTFGNIFTYSGQASKAYSNKIYYSGLNILVNKLTETPILFNEKKEGVKSAFESRYYSKNISNNKRLRMKDNALTELENHPLNELFDTPNDYQSGIELMEDFWYNYGFGDGYLFFEKLEFGRDAGKPITVHSIRRDRVYAVQSTDQFDPVAFYYVTTLNGVRIRVEKEDMLHLKRWNPNPAGMTGTNPADISAIDIGLNKANNEARGAAMVNGGRGTLFSAGQEVTNEGDVVDKISFDEMQQIKSTMRTDFAGTKNNGRMHWVNGDVKVQAFGDTSAELELVSAEVSNWKNIFAILGIPYVLAPVTEGATESNVKTGFKALVTNNIVPCLRKFDHKLNAKIKQWYPDVIACHDLTEFSELAPDLELMANVFGKPNLTVNELRAIFNYDELPNGTGSVVLIPSSVVPIDQAGSAAAFNMLDQTTGQSGNQKKEM